MDGKSLFSVGAQHSAFTYMTLWTLFPEAFEYQVHVLCGSLAL